MSDNADANFTQLEERTDGWMDGWTGGRTDGRTDRHRRTVGQTDGSPPGPLLIVTAGDCYCGEVPLSPSGV